MGNEGNASNRPALGAHHAEPWQRDVWKHLPEYLAEFGGTAILLFCVVTVVSWCFSNQSPLPRIVPSMTARLFIAGLLLGSAGSLVAVSPLGKLSGAHLNPAISAGFSLLGTMEPRDLPGYAIGQLAGAFAGTVAGVAVWRHIAPSVHDAALAPGLHVTAVEAVIGEAVCTFLLCAAIFVCVSHHRLLRWTPLLAAIAVMLLVGVDGAFSGAGMNPARALAPASVAGLWSGIWIYVIGPMVGGTCAGLVHRFGPLEAKTAKLFHDRQYRSIFTGQSDHVANQHVRTHMGQPAHATPKLRHEKHT